MPDGPSLHIDDDWKKQAQEEKKRLVEQEAQKAKAVAPAGAVGSVTAAAAGSAPAAAAAGARDVRQVPAASFASLLNSVVTQALFHLGDIAVRGSTPNVNLDMAKHHIDTLNVLEEKTKNNLAPEEQRLLDGALYETRMRFVQVGSQYAELP